jgi:Zn-dependent peptidase ImmA (M78 family)
MSDVEELVKFHIKKFGTNDPYEIASRLNIHVIQWNFNYEVFGMYRYERRNKFIFINNNLASLEKPLVCGHELYHAVCHTRFNTSFLRKKTYFPTGRYENAANEYSVKLRLANFDIDEGMTKESICKILGIFPEMARFI